MKLSAGLPDRLVNGMMATVRLCDSELGGSIVGSAESVTGVGFGPEGVDAGCGLGVNREDSAELGVISARLALFLNSGLWLVPRSEARGCRVFEFRGSTG